MKRAVRRCSDDLMSGIEAMNHVLLPDRLCRQRQQGEHWLSKGRPAPIRHQRLCLVVPLLVDPLALLCEPSPSLSSLRFVMHVWTV